MITLAAKTTALVLIDLQNGILGMPTAPRPASEVLAGGEGARREIPRRRRARRAGARRFRRRLRRRSARPRRSAERPPAGRHAGSLDDTGRGLAAPGDILITKRQWGAFTGTDLDLQLRRRGVKDIVIGGIATNFGVESTVRHAWELGYNVVVAEDLCATFSPELHEVAIKFLLPRISRIASSDAIALA